MEIENSIYKPDSLYKNELIYSLQYPKGGELKKDTGKIIDINNGIIKHSISTDKGSSGSPLILSNHKVIGIHKGTIKQKNYNAGIFMKDFIIDLENNVIPIKEIIYKVLLYKLIKVIKYKKLMIKVLLQMFLVCFLIYITIPKKEKIYYGNGNLSYYGYIKNGYLEGFGISYYKNGKKKYIGNCNKGKKNGNGIYFYEDGSLKYNGTFSNDCFDGYGIYYSKGNYTFEYKGEFKNNTFNGYGAIILKDLKIKYKGNWINNHMNE